MTIYSIVTPSERTITNNSGFKVGDLVKRVRQ
jgi:hypothetical protein